MFNTNITVIADIIITYARRSIVRLFTVTVPKVVYRITGNTEWTDRELTRIRSNVGIVIMIWSSPVWFQVNEPWNFQQNCRAIRIWCELWREHNICCYYFSREKWKISVFYCLFYLLSIGNFLLWRYIF